MLYAELDEEAAEYKKLDSSSPATRRKPASAYAVCFFLHTTAGTAVALFSYCNSVRLSHGWISQKPFKLESPNLHHWLPGRL